MAEGSGGLRSLTLGITSADPTNQTTQTVIRETVVAGVPTFERVNIISNADFSNKLAIQLPVEGVWQVALQEISCVFDAVDPPTNTVTGEPRKKYWQKKVFVTCNIVANTFLGSAQSPIIFEFTPRRIVDFGERLSLKPLQPLYFARVATQRLDTISIRITDEDGDLVQFSIPEAGNVKGTFVTLLFRQISGGLRS